MKYRFPEIAHDVMKSFMNYMVVVSVWTALNTVAEVQDKPLMFILFFLVPLALYFVRLKVEGFFLFTIIHILIPVIGVAVFATEFAEKIVLGMILIGISAASYGFSIKNDEAGEPLITPVFAGIVMIGAMFFVGFADPDRTIIVPKLVLCYATMFLPSMYLEKLMWYDYINSKTISNVPTNETLKMTGPIVGVMAGFYAVTSFVCLDEKAIGKISSALRRFMNNFMVWLFSGVPKTDGNDQTYSEYAEQNAGGFDPASLVAEEKEPSPIAEFLARIAIYIAIIAIFALILISVVMGVMAVYRRLHNRKRKRLVKYSDSCDEVREKIAVKSKKKATRINEDEGPYAQRIRKLYKKIVLRNHQLADRPQLLSAREFAALFAEDKRDGAMRFAYIYEKARYSAAECTRADYYEAKRFASSVI